MGSHYAGHSSSTPTTTAATGETSTTTTAATSETSTTTSAGTTATATASTATASTATVSTATASTATASTATASTATASTRFPGRTVAGNYVLIFIFLASATLHKFLVFEIIFVALSTQKEYHSYDSKVRYGNRLHMHNLTFKKGVVAMRTVVIDSVLLLPFRFVLGESITFYGIVTLYFFKIKQFLLHYINLVICSIHSGYHWKMYVENVSPAQQ